MPAESIRYIRYPGDPVGALGGDKIESWRRGSLDITAPLAKHDVHIFAACLSARL